MSIRDGYEAWAATYDHDRNLTRDLDARVTRAALGGERWPRIVELGCGTGKNTAFLAEIGAHVLALDFSAAMLARARAKVAAPNVTFTVADLTRRWPCEDGGADLVVGNLVLEHIADLRPIFAEAARCLRPGGALYLSELHPFRQYGGAKARFERDGAMTEIAAFTHHLSDYLDAARDAGFTLAGLAEHWHDEDRAAPPRLLTMRLECTPYSVRQ